LVVVPSAIGESELRNKGGVSSPPNFPFLVIEPKGILTDVARLKHLVLCSSGLIPARNLLFVTASDCDSITIGKGDIRCSLSGFISVLPNKMKVIFGDDA
jgi:hypothetical protein